MNSRARNRLIAVTALILLVAVAVLVTVGLPGGSAPATVKVIAGDSAFVGRRVTVTGSVIGSSWNKKSNPMIFNIHDQGATSGPQLKVIYGGAAPASFGNLTIAIVTGTVKPGGVIDANEMETKCPSTYATKTGADTVTQMLKAGVSAELPIVGYLKSGSLHDAAAPYRFILQSTPTGGDSVEVQFQGAMPTVKRGGQVVAFGQLEKSGKFLATQVSLPQ
jgi:cytochrome c-type biogenesis protein CcmE